MRLPQARDFTRLRLLLSLIASGLHDSASLGQKMGVKEKYASRHADYYREAAEVLGFLERGGWSLTASGKRLLTTTERSVEERDLLRAAVANAVELGDLRDALLSESRPDIESLVDYALGKTSRLTRGTIKRRVADTLSWRVRLGFESARNPSHRGKFPSDAQESQVAGDRPVDVSDFPNHSVLPFNWAQKDETVAQVVLQDLYASDEALLVMGYASLEELCNFVGRMETGPRLVRAVFGTEPFRGRILEQPIAGYDDLTEEVRKYWLERGISILSALSVLKTVAAIERGALKSRISRRSQGLHAKMFLAGEAATIGSSNFTTPGLRTQLEGNVRVTAAAEASPYYFSEAWRLGEVYWRLSHPFDHALRDLLHTLLRNVTWEEALARGCAELLEGQWARAYLRSEFGYDDLWPSQVQGIGQALYVLMEVGSVLIADATGSGKTKLGAWLLHALRQRLVTQGRPISDPVLVSPPALGDYWADELRHPGIRVEVHSQGALSNARAGRHARVTTDVETARLLVLDEGHNFINASNRTAKVITNLADHVILFTATPMSRDVSDLLGIADLLGADNLDDETLEILQDAGWRHRRTLTEEDRRKLRRAVKRFTVRRTKRILNALIDREPGRYRNKQGVRCRYPEHKARYYELGEAHQDRLIASEITRLAHSLRGVVMFRRPIELTPRDRELGRTPEVYVRMRLLSAKALARYQLRSALRSSRAALYEHIHGTKAAVRMFDIRDVEKGETGDMLATLATAKESGPPASDLHAVLPDWLRDRELFKRACDEEADCYRRISKLCLQLSEGRERAKVERLLELVRTHARVVAFDSRPITLFLLRGFLQASPVRVYVATGAQLTERRAVLKSFAPGERKRSELALCSDAMSEGVNLQGASALVHLDMPSVVRVAEQRVGRIDRMDSPHRDVESWWPRDAREFALAADERLAARAALVGDIFGSNLDLPTDDSEPAVVDPEEIQAEMRQQEQRQLELLDDAFAPVRSFIEGQNALIDPNLYTTLRTSTARVVSAVAAVRANTAWGFFTLPGTDRVAPRWLFVDDADGTVCTALDDVAAHLRHRLNGAENIKLDESAVDTMKMLLDRAQASSVSLLPRRKQRALGLMRQVLAVYLDQDTPKRISRRTRLVEELLAFTGPDAGIDFDVLLDSWLAIIRPLWREALQTRKGARRTRLRRLQGLLRELQSRPLTDAQLAELRDSVHVARPLAERVVAAIVGVPA